MVKELINIEMERDNMQQKWGFTVQVKKKIHFKNEQNTDKKTQTTNATKRTK